MSDYFYSFEFCLLEAIPNPQLYPHLKNLVMFFFEELADENNQ